MSLAPGAGSEVISIIDADPDLGGLLDPAERDRARREAVTRVRRLSPGKWIALEALEPDVHHQGFLVIDGLLSREVEVLGRRCVELIGDADVLRPWGWDPSGSHVNAEIEWIVLEPTRMAVLDHALVARMNPWPQLGLELFARSTRRAHWARQPRRGPVLGVARRPPRRRFAAVARSRWTRDGPRPLNPECRPPTP